MKRFECFSAINLPAKGLTFCLLFSASSLLAQVATTGTWSGAINETFMWGSGSPSRCANGTPAPFSTSGQATLAIAQNGTSFAGSMTFPHRWMDHGDGNGGCTWVDGGMYAVALSGTVSGSTITGSATTPNNNTVPFTLSVSGSTFSGSFKADTESASFTLTKQGSTPPKRRAVKH